jgi:hypothetical protein
MKQNAARYFLNHVCDDFSITDFQVDNPAAGIILTLPGKIGYQAFFIRYTHNKILLPRQTGTKTVSRRAAELAENIESFRVQN